MEVHTEHNTTLTPHNHKKTLAGIGRSDQSNLGSILCHVRPAPVFSSSQVSTLNHNFNFSTLCDCLPHLHLEPSHVPCSGRESLKTLVKIRTHFNRSEILALCFQPCVFKLQTEGRRSAIPHTHHHKNQISHNNFLNTFHSFT